MLITVIQAFFYLMPAHLANSSLTLLSRFKIWEKLNVPLDFGYVYMGERLFGKTKTCRGLFGAVVFSTLIITLQTLLYQYVPASRWLFLFEYKMPEILWLGFLFGVGFVLADLIKSFFKRRLHINSTAPWVPFDQMDFMGALILGLFFYKPSNEILFAIIVFSPLLPVIANLIAYKMGWKKVWW